jgi:hypothetical protein
MLAPRTAKPQTKAAASAINTLAFKNLAPAARPFAVSAIEQAHVLQKTIGNQAALRLLSQRASDPTGNERGDRREQEAGGLAREAPGASWDFSKSPIFPPYRANRPPAQFSLGAMPLPGVVQPKLAVGRVDDPLEHEADRVADQVMRMPVPGPAVGRGQVRGAVVQRTCAICEASQDRDDEVGLRADVDNFREPLAVPIIRQRLGRSAIPDALAVQRDIGQDE